MEKTFMEWEYGPVGFRVIKYMDATEVKFKNRRVMVWETDQKDLQLAFKRIIEKGGDESTAVIQVERGKVAITSLTLSVPAAVALYHALRLELDKIYAL